MFGFLKSFVRKLAAETPAETLETQAAADAFAQAGAPAPYASPAAPRLAPTARAGQAAHQNGKGIQLPLQAILAALPLELHPKLRYTDVGERMVNVPLEKVLAQLSRGTVTITFGELRLAAPDVFTPEPDRDKVLVPLPLSEILNRLNPALISRRRVQRTVEVPEEISSPFDAQGHGLVFSVAPSRAESAAQAPNARQVQPAPFAPQAPPAPAIPPAPIGMPAAPARGSITSTPTPPPPIAMPGAPTMPSAGRAVRDFNANRSPIGMPAAPAPAPAPIPMPKPVGDGERLAMSAAAAPAELPKPAANEPPPLLVALTSLAEAWPDSVRREIVEGNLVDAKVALPHDSVKQALKQGRIAFSWKSIRSWLKSVAVPAVSVNDSVVLELPLKVVTPLFLTRQQETQKSQQRVSVDVEIPNLFFGFPQSDSGPAEVGGVAVAAPPRPSDTNYYVWSDTNDMAQVDSSDVKRSTPGTKFVAKYATPNEVVSRAAALDGVAGALIALPDGLMVASQLPADLNADTIAAFLPQIFGKVSSCTKELRMGDLNNLNFTVGNVPWKIFRVNAIFFAAFGKPGEPLPTSQLAALAADLDHKPR